MATLCCRRTANRGACFSEDGRYRYALWRRWKKSGPWVTFLMLNPSLATVDHSDPTVKRCEAFSRSWNCAGIEVVNVFALVSPHPTALHGRRNPVEHEPGRNDEHINRAADRSDLIIAAWGINVAHPTFAKRMVAIQALLKNRDIRALRITKDGHPSHPLYLPATRTPEPYAMRPSCVPAPGEARAGNGTSNKRR